MDKKVFQNNYTQLTANFTYCAVICRESARAKLQQSGANYYQQVLVKISYPVIL